MPRSPLSEDEIAEFRSRAIAVAERLFAEAGVEGVTMRALSKELGCSPMTPYRYFDDQEHLLAEVRASAFARLALLQDEAARGGATPVATIRALRRSYIEFARREPNLYLLMFSLPPPKTPRPELERAAAAAFFNLRKAVREAVEARELAGDAETLAHLIWAELHGLVSLHGANKLNFGRSMDELAPLSLLDFAIDANTC